MVIFFVPNIIGYVRIISGVAAFAFTRDPAIFAGLYTLSQGLDALDGVFARALDQSELGLARDPLPLCDESLQRHASGRCWTW
jgi:phosphatidylglycerophosphate synthase